jgi:hypothetical protein
MIYVVKYWSYKQFYFSQVINQLFGRDKRACNGPLFMSQQLRKDKNNKISMNNIYMIILHGKTSC